VIAIFDRQLSELRRKYPDATGSGGALSLETVLKPFLTSMSAHRRVLKSIAIPVPIFKADA
jgi:hypothetical protein